MVECSVSLLLRGQLAVVPNHLLLFNQPGNQASLKLCHGSGHFHVDYVVKPRPPVGEVQYNRETSRVNVSLLCPTVIVEVLAVIDNSWLKENAKIKNSEI